MKMTWQEGKYFDLWVIVHFLSGVFIGSCLFFLGFSGLISLFITFCLILWYEVFETVFRIKEHNENRILDIVIGLFGSFLGFYIFVLYPEANLDIKSILVIEAIILGFFSFVGWFNYIKYGRGI